MRIVAVVEAEFVRLEPDAPLESGPDLKAEFGFVHVEGSSKNPIVEDEQKAFQENKGDESCQADFHNR